MSFTVQNLKMEIVFYSIEPKDKDCVLKYVPANEQCVLQYRTYKWTLCFTVSNPRMDIVFYSVQP